MHMIIALQSLENPDLKRLACFSHQLFEAPSYLIRQHLVAVLRHPNKVTPNLKYRMNAVSVVYSATALHPANFHN